VFTGREINGCFEKLHCRKVILGGSDNTVEPLACSHRLGGVLVGMSICLSGFILIYLPNTIAGHRVKGVKNDRDLKKKV
jgi:hypothetical protein